MGTYKLILTILLTSAKWPHNQYNIPAILAASGTTVK